MIALCLSPLCGQGMNGVDRVLIDCRRCCASVSLTTESVSHDLCILSTAQSDATEAGQPSPTATLKVENWQESRRYWTRTASIGRSDAQDCRICPWHVPCPGNCRSWGQGLANPARNGHRKAFGSAGLASGSRRGHGQWSRVPDHQPHHRQPRSGWSLSPRRANEAAPVKRSCPWRP